MPTHPNSAVSTDSSFPLYKRPSKDEYYLGIALAVAKRSTCLRTGYGAIAVLRDRLASSGYNGSRRGGENCCDRGFCFREKSETRTDYHLCNAVHAEAGVLLNAQVSLIGATIYLAGFDMKTGEEKVGVACHPCVNCYRFMIQAGIENIFIRDIDGTVVGGSMAYWNFLEG
jgi:dCMP deaminase